MIESLSVHQDYIVFDPEQFFCLKILYYQFNLIGFYFNVFHCLQFMIQSFTVIIQLQFRMKHYNVANNVQQVFDYVYNKMTKSYIVIVLLLVLLSYVKSYKLQMGNIDLIPQVLDLHSNSSQQLSKIKCYEQMFIFPYKVYQFQTRGSNITYARSYLFQRIDYQQIEESLSLQERTLQSLDQYQYLFQRVPQIILLEGEQNQYLQIIRTDDWLWNGNFVIKNSTVENYKTEQGKIHLNFYSLDLNHYIYQLIRIGKRQLEKQLRSEKDIGQKIKKIAAAGYNQIQKMSADQLNLHYMLNQIFQNDAFFNYQELINHLLHKEIVQTVDNNTKWSVTYDSFRMMYLAASISQNIVKDQTGKQISSNILDIVYIVSAKGDIKRVQRIKQSLASLKLQSIQHIQLCNTIQNRQLLIADNQSFYQIDITKQQWHIITYKQIKQIKNIFFTNQCRLFTIQYANSHTIINQWNSIGYKLRLERQGEVSHSYVISNQYFVMCMADLQCTVFDWKLNQICNLTVLNKMVNVGWSYRVKLQNNTIIEVIEARIISGQKIFQKHIQQNNILASNVTQLWRAIYPIDIYLHKQKNKIIQMDKIVWKHLLRLYQHKNNSSTSKLQTFLNQVDPNQITCINQTTYGTQTIYNLNDTSNWSICSFQFITESSTQITIDFDSPTVGFNIYICSAAIQNYMGINSVQCSLFFGIEQSVQELSKVYRLKSNNYIKIYLVRPMEFTGIKSPVFYMKDLQKQQFQFASNIFYIIIITLFVISGLFVIFVIAKPIIRGVMIYNGWIQQRQDPSYPLNWLNLRIKDKKLRAAGYLKYVPHRNENMYEEKPCIFCLNQLERGKIIAQLFCNHEFHCDCFREWIRNQQNPRCPTCRRQFTRNNLMEFQ